MYLIKKCPACGRPLRFPLDRGTIKVRCTCGNTFTADPDDPRLYDDASFDLSYEKKTRGATGKKKQKRQKEARTFAKRKAAVINYLLSIKYTLQNFKVLPTAQQKRIVTAGLLILALIILLGLWICSYPAYTPMPPQDYDHDRLLE